MASNIFSIEDQELDNVINEQSEGIYKSDNGVVSAEFYQEGNVVTFKTAGRSVSWQPLDMKYVDEFGTEDLLYTVEDAPLEVKANYARFNRAMPDVDDWFIVENGRIKHQILLQGFQRDPMPWLFGNIYIVFGGSLAFDDDLLVSANGSIVDGPFETDGQIELIDGNGRIIFTLPPVVVFDSKIPERASIGGKYIVTSSESGILSFCIAVDNAWISDTARNYPLVIDPTVVVSSAYDTSGNCGRKIVRLSNGWLVAVADETTGSKITHFYKSTDDGATWTQLCSTNGGDSIGTALTSTGTTIMAVGSFSDYSGIWYVKFDAATQTNVQIPQSLVYNALSNNRTDPYLSVVVDGSGTYHVAFSSFTASYANSYNVYYTKSTDGGANWSAVTQLSLDDASGYHNRGPSIMIKSDGYPAIAWYFSVASGNYEIKFRAYNGSSWNSASARTTTNSLSYASALVKKNGSNIGRIAVAFYENGQLAVYYSDNASTWTAFTGTGNTATKATISENAAGDIYVSYQNGSAIDYKVCPNGTTAFGSATTLTSAGTNPGAMEREVSTLIGIVYMDASVVKFEKLVFNTAPTAPTGLTRSNYDAAASGVYTWTFTDPDAFQSQSAYQILIKKVSDGSTVVDTGKVTSTTSSHTVSASTLTNNTQYQWQVKCWDNYDVSGPYSSLSSFWASAKPSVTITNPVSDGATVAVSSFTAQWSFSDPESSGQAAYQLKLTSDADVVLWDSGKTSDTSARSRTIGYALANITSYKIKMTVWDDKDVASAEVVRTFNVSYATPLKPVFTVTKEAYDNLVTIDNGGNNSPNLLGTDGNCESLTGWTLGGTAAVSTTQKRSGTNSFKLTSAGANASAAKDFTAVLDVGKYYFIAAWVYIESYTSGTVYLSVNDVGTGNIRYQTNAVTGTVGSWQLITLKIPTANTLVGAGFRLYCIQGSSGTAVSYFDEIRLYEVDAATYAKIGVDATWTGPILENRFPYSDSTTDVAVTTRGRADSCLLPKFKYWTLHENTRMKQANFAGKVSASTVENPHISKYGAAASLLAPSSGSWSGELNTTDYGKIATLNGTSISPSTTTNTFQSQVEAPYNLIEHVLRNYGASVFGANVTTADRVTWLKANVAKLIVNAHVSGSSPAGNKAYLGLWNTSSSLYDGTQSHTNGSITKLTQTSTSMAVRIDANGFFTVICYADPSNGTTASTLNVDFIEVEVYMVAGSIPIPDYDLTLNATVSSQYSEVFINVAPSTQYTIAVDAGSGAGLIVRKSDGSVTYVNDITAPYSAAFTTDSATYQIYVRLFNQTATGLFAFSKPKLEIGSTATPHEPLADPLFPNTATNDLYRRKTGESSWNRIAANLAQHGTYKDYTVASGQAYEYMVRAYGSNTALIDSVVMTGAAIPFRGVVLHEVASPAATLYAFMIDGDGRSENWQADSSLMKFAGRTRAVAEFGESEEGQIKVRLKMTRESGDLEALADLIKSRQTLCYRDGRGRKMFGIIPQMPTTDERYGYSVDVELIEIDYTEVV